MEVLDDKKMLRQMIESVEPKKIFINLLSKMNDVQKRHLLSALNVDVKTVQPTYFHKHYIYKKREHSNNAFLFIDEEYRIIGMLKGSKWNSEYFVFEKYDKKSTKNQYGKFVIEKNRNTMTQKAFHILMFSHSQMKELNIQIINHTELQKSFNLKSKNRFNKNFAKEEVRVLSFDFKNKLANYREKKYECLTHDEVSKMALDVIVFLSNNAKKAIPNIELKMSQSFVSRHYYYYDSENNIKHQILLIPIVSRIYADFLNEKIKLDNKQTSSFRDYNEYRITIIQFYNLFVNNWKNNIFKKIDLKTVDNQFILC